MFEIVIEMSHLNFHAKINTIRAKVLFNFSPFFHLFSTLKNLFGTLKLCLRSKLCNKKKTIEKFCKDL